MTFFLNQAEPHCIPSPTVTCVASPCHHGPESEDCKAATQEARLVETRSTVTNATIGTPTWQRAVEALNVVVPTQGVAPKTYTVSKIKQTAQELSALTLGNDPGTSSSTKAAIDKLFPAVPPPQIDGKPASPADQPSREQIERATLQAVRALPHQAAAIKALTAPSENRPLPANVPDAVRNASIPPELLKRHTLELGAAYRQLTHAAYWSRVAEAGSEKGKGIKDLTPQTIGTPDQPNLASSLEEVFNHLRQAFGEAK